LTFPRRLVLSFLLLLAAIPASAAPINVVYRRSILDGFPGMDAGLPVFLCDCFDFVRFRFVVPDYASLVNINSIQVSVDVYDDLADGRERGNLVFVLNGGLPNIHLTNFQDLTGTDEFSPLTVSAFLDPLDLPAALLEIQNNGVFFIRVNRRGTNPLNDFYVTNPQVFIDGDLAVPEPATIGLVGASLSAVLLGRRRFRMAGHRRS